VSERAGTERGAPGAGARSVGRSFVTAPALSLARFVEEATTAISPVASWLLVAVALDLVVTRLALRLAIFVPKGDALAALVGIAARVAAVVDTLVPIVAAVLLGALLVSAGTWRASLTWRLGLIATAGVAIGGIALTVLPPTPAGMVVLEGLVAVAAVLFAATGVRAGTGSASGVGTGVAVRVGLAALGAATALAALARVADAGSVLADRPALAAPSLAVFLAGEVIFVIGAMAVGVAGLRAVPFGSRLFRIGLAAGVLLGAALVGTSLAIPGTTSMLLIWSVGLVSGLLPLALVAPIAALALAGLVALGSVRRDLALGLGVILVAGYGLAASGLVLAGLLGLALASRALLVDASRAG
jgi:hypothetical protein